MIGPRPGPRFDRGHVGRSRLGRPSALAGSESRARPRAVTGGRTVTVRVGDSDWVRDVRRDAERSDSERSDSNRSDSERSDSDRSDSDRSDSDRSDSERSALLSLLGNRPRRPPHWGSDSFKFASGRFRVGFCGVLGSTPAQGAALRQRWQT